MARFLQQGTTTCLLPPVAISTLQPRRRYFRQLRASGHTSAAFSSAPFAAQHPKKPPYTASPCWLELVQFFNGRGDLHSIRFDGYMRGYSPLLRNWFLSSKSAMPCITLGREIKGRPRLRYDESSCVCGTLPTSLTSLPAGHLLTAIAHNSPACFLPP